MQRGEEIVRGVQSIDQPGKPVEEAAAGDLRPHHSGGEDQKDGDGDDAIAAAKADERVAAHIEGKTVIKEISIPNKIINIVVK